MGGRTGGILPPADLDEFLDVLDLLRHLGDYLCWLRGRVDWIVAGVQGFR